MLPYRTDVSLQGAKTARMEQRITPQTKELIEQAASLLGINASEFMVVAAARMARETVENQGHTSLTPPSHAAFLEALDATEPTHRLIELMKVGSNLSAVK